MVEALVSAPAGVREQVRGEATELAERSAADVEHEPLAAVWCAVAEVAAGVAAVADDPLHDALCDVLASTGTVTDAIGRCPTRLRRVLAVACARTRDHDAIDGRLSAAVWAALAALSMDVDDAERRALRAAEDDALGIVAPGSSTERE